MDLSELGEFGFLARVARWVPPGTAPVGIGDDAAVLDVSEGSSVVATADALVEGVHFRWDWSKPADVGYKSVTANVSDLAAMGARPRWLLLTLCAPRSTTEEILHDLYEGVQAACVDYGTELVGGDTVSADTFVVSVAALGDVAGDPLRRSGAKVGDVLAVTGPLGRAAAGVNLLLSQDPKKVSPEDALACMAAHTRPLARVAEGLALRRSGVHAAIDISDGLGSDVRRLAEASGVGAEIDLERLPVAAEARRVADARGWDIERMVLGGGEDYELLVALPPDQLGSLEIELIQVGRVVEDGVWLVREGRREPLELEGWDHFKT
ncbi:MAG: thiamine-phosphate kinase [Actinomycetota bacterium]